MLCYIIYYILFRVVRRKKTDGFQNSKEKKKINLYPETNSVHTYIYGTSSVHGGHLHLGQVGFATS